MKVVIIGHANTNTNDVHVAHNNTSLQVNTRWLISIRPGTRSLHKRGYDQYQRHECFHINCAANLVYYFCTRTVVEIESKKILQTWALNQQGCHMSRNAFRSLSTQSTWRIYVAARSVIRVFSISLYLQIHVHVSNIEHNKRVCIIIWILYYTAIRRTIATV